MIEPFDKFWIIMPKKKTREKFKITVKESSLSEKEKRELLFQCFDILLSSKPKKKEE